MDRRWPTPTPSPKKNPKLIPAYPANNNGRMVMAEFNLSTSTAIGSAWSHPTPTPTPNPYPTAPVINMLITALRQLPTINCPYGHHHSDGHGGGTPITQEPVNDGAIPEPLR